MYSSIHTNAHNEMIKKAAKAALECTLNFVWDFHLHPTLQFPY